MWECNYSREPINYRLLWLRLIKKWWRVPVSIIAGALIVFGVYFFYKTVITGRTYLVENKYYINFAEDSSGKQYDWVNQYTWSELADMNVFIDGIYEDLSGSVSKDDLRKASDCTIEADGRYLYMRITTNSPELSQRIADSYEKTLFAFCESHKEFKEITCEHKGEVKENSNIRVVEMLIVGAVCGLLVLCVFWLIKEINDTSIYIPATLEYRYHIPTLGAKSMEEYEENSRHFLEGKKTALIFVDEETDIELPFAKEVKAFKNPCLNPEGLKDISEYDAKVLAVKAGNHNGKQIERVIEELTRLEIKVDAFVLTDEDEKLIKKYYKC
ncbi:MAG: hypothetical protein IK121_02545 [Lachnospiraceae bacterium]|nr:hypothetical protein [Lachnospiraceae bacterium]